MRKYKLLAGGHSGPDFSQPPILDNDGNPVAYPTREYNRNDVVHSDYDLVAMFGRERFKDVGASQYTSVLPKRGDKPGRALPPSPRAALKPNEPIPNMAFPGGQVSNGHQGATSVEDADGQHTISGPLAAEDLAELSGKTTPTGADGEDSEEEVETEGGSEEEIHPTATEETLKEMTPQELQQFAKEEQIDIAGLKTKAAVIKKILSSAKK